jgi:hypothetical protein
MRLVLFSFASALAFLSGCSASEPGFSNFDYEVIDGRAVVPGTDVTLPSPADCLHYIADNGYYACVAGQDGEFVDLIVAESDSPGGARQRTFMGGVVIGNGTYFVHRNDRDGPDAQPVVRLGTLFPQGRAGVYVDCLSYDGERVYAVRDGVETTYDYEMNIVGSEHGEPCTIRS